MNDSEALIRTLKRSLKAAGRTYRELADMLNLSESSVKRILASGNLSLKRLQQICDTINISIADLAELSRQELPVIAELSEQEELQLVNDEKLLIVTVCILNYWQFDEIIDFYQISASECIQRLAQLDRIGMLELLPGNRIKLKIAPHFHWRPNGPIQRFFQQHVERAFFNSHFDKPTEKLLVLNGTLSEASTVRFNQRLSELATEFNALSKADQSLPLSERHATTAVLAVRNWRFALFEKHKRG